MFDAKIKSDVLKGILSVMTTLVDEAKFVVGSDGITLKIVDPSHVAMAEITIPAKAFEEYKADACELGVDVHKLTDVMRLAGKGDVIGLSHDTDKNAFVVSIGHITRRMQLIDTHALSDPKVPTLTLAASVRLTADKISQGIRASESISDHLALFASAEGFKISSKGDTDSVSMDIPKSEMLEIKCTEDTKAMYSISYFANMIKSVGDSEITIAFGNDYPCEMTFILGEVKVRYLLAPRIEG